MISFAEFKTKRRDTEMVDTPLSFADFKAKKSKETKTEIPTKIDINFSIPSFKTQTSTPAILKEGTFTPQTLIAEAGKGMARGYAATGQKIVSDIGQRFYKLEPNELVDPDTFFGVSETASQIGRKLFGKDAPFSATTEDAELLEMFGVDKETAAGTGGSLTLLLTATDLFGGGVKGIAGATKAIKNVNKVDDAIKLAKNMGFADDIAAQYAEVFVKARTTKEAKESLEAAIKLQNSTKLAPNAPKTGLDFGAFKRGEAYKGETDLTTKILKDLEGKTTVSKQYILDATNRGELKQVERDLIRDILERETKVDTALTFKNLQADDYNTGIFGKDFDEPVKFYRGGTLKPNSKGEMWFTPEDWQALKYSEDFDAPSVDKVSEAFINSKKPFLLEGSEMGAYSKEIKDNWKKIGLKETDWNINDPKVKDKAIAYAKKNGYDSVFFRDSSIDGQTPMSSLVIFDEKLAKYNKIGSKVERTGKEQLSDTINVSDFAKKVKAELLPLKRTPLSQYDIDVKPMDRGRYENISLPDGIRGKIQNYQENIYESPIKTSAGNTHFSGAQGSRNYFGHTRIEDMADNKTRRVIEVQSDLHQRGRLAEEFEGLQNKLYSKAILPETVSKIQKLNPKITVKDIAEYIKNCL